MKSILPILFILFSGTLWGKSLILLGHFDAFGKASFNNSEKVAKLLLEKFKDHPEIELRLCGMETVFDKSFYQLEDCLKSLSERPDMVLGLGESNCNLKIEIMARNLDRTFGPDNEGNERINTPIINESPGEIGFKYPLAEMYCAVEERDRRSIEVSNNAGSFVCNNLAYQFARHYEEQVFGFIHVPANNCRNLEQKTEMSVRALSAMITAAVQVKDVVRLPIYKEELEIYRRNRDTSSCRREFFKRAKGADEKDFWPFLKTL